MSAYPDSYIDSDVEFGHFKATHHRFAVILLWWLGVGGYLLCEIGETQGSHMDLAFGTFDRHIRQDLTGRDRYVVARKGSPCCV